MAGRADEQAGSNVARRNGAVPLYHRLFLDLRDAILSGRRPHGSLLPTEHRLAEEHGVSRITARRALDELALAGLVDRRRRLGTRVIHRVTTQPIEAHLEQALDTLIAFGRDTQVRVVSVDRVPASDELAAALEVAPGTELVKAVRVRDRDGEPLGHITSHALSVLAPLFTPDALLRRPLLELLREAGYRIGSGSEVIGAHPADDALATALRIDWRSPVLTVERTVRDVDGRPLLRTVAQYRGDRYRIALALAE